MFILEKKENMNKLIKLPIIPTIFIFPFCPPKLFSSFVMIMSALWVFYNAIFDKAVLLSVIYCKKRIKDVNEICVQDVHGSTFYNSKKLIKTHMSKVGYDLWWSMIHPNQSID